MQLLIYQTLSVKNLGRSCGCANIHKMLSVVSLKEENTEGIKEGSEEN